MLYPNCAPAWKYVAIPLGSSSAAPVMRPGPSCFTRGSSAMLLSNLTIAVLQKRTMSPTRRRRWRSKHQVGANRIVRAFCASRIRRDGASEGPKALSTPMCGCRWRGTYYHSDNYSRRTTCATHNGRDDRPVPRSCKGKNAERQTRPMAGRVSALAYGRSLGLGHLGDDVVRDVSRHGL